jgi:hypothetical protein
MHLEHSCALCEILKFHSRNMVIFSKFLDLWCFGLYRDLAGTMGKNSKIFTVSISHHVCPCRKFVKTSVQFLHISDWADFDSSWALVTSLKTRVKIYLRPSYLNVSFSRQGKVCSLYLHVECQISFDDFMETKTFHKENLTGCRSLVVVLSLSKREVVSSSPAQT